MGKHLLDQQLHLLLSGESPDDLDGSTVIGPVDQRTDGASVLDTNNTSKSHKCSSS